mgnify:FL=1
MPGREDTYCYCSRYQTVPWQRRSISAVERLAKTGRKEYEVRKSKTWRVPPDHKDFKMEMDKDFQQIEDQEMHCYFARAKKDVRSNLRKKIEGR